MTRDRWRQQLALLGLLVALLDATGRTARASVSLTAFSATGGPDRITVTWSTASELDTFGFYVWRTTVAAAAFEAIPADQRARVNAQPIAAVGDVTGASYALDDSDVVADVTYFYWLEDVDNSGLSTYHGAPSARLTTTGVIGRPPTATAAPSVTPVAAATTTATPPQPPPATATATPTARPVATATSALPPTTTPLPTADPTAPPEATADVAASAPPATRARRTVAAATVPPTPTPVGVGEDSAESPPPPSTAAPEPATAAPTLAAVAVIGADAAVPETQSADGPPPSAPARSALWLTLAAAVGSLGTAALLGAVVLRRQRPPAQGNATHGDD